MPRLQSFGYAALAALSVLYAQCAPQAVATNSLQLTAIGAENNKSTIQCWTLSQVFANVSGVR